MYIKIVSQEKQIVFEADHYAVIQEDDGSYLTLEVDGRDRHFLISDDQIAYIMNDQGDTIETLAG